MRAWYAPLTSAKGSTLRRRPPADPCSSPRPSGLELRRAMSRRSAGSSASPEQALALRVLVAGHGGLPKRWRMWTSLSSLIAVLTGPLGSSCTIGIPGSRRLGPSSSSGC